VRTARAAPLFAIVTVTGADEAPASAPPKLMVPVGETVAAACTAVPPTVTICGLCGALAETITWADRVPVCAGSKMTLMTQVLVATTGLCEHLSVSAKSPGSVPPKLMVIATGVVPVLLTETTCATRLAPTV
jgi:hypothetical protein